MTTKKSIYIGLSALIVSAASLLYYFNFLHESKTIEPPLSLEVPYDTLTFRAEEGMKHHHFTGSNVTIPGNAFMDKDGYPVIGNVSVLYREFHSPEEIFLSGIPMGSMDDETNRALQSAGMFEMKAFQSGEELKIASGKNIGVELAAFRASDDYKIFQLNGNSKWDEMGSPALAENKQKQKDLAAIPDLPDKPDGPVIIDIDADYSQHPDLAHFKNYRWALTDVPQNKNFGEEMRAFRINWDRMKVETFDKTKNLYKLTASAEMRNYENRTIWEKYSVIVTPVLTGEDYDNALAAFNKTLDEYNVLAAQIQKEEERLALEADMLNAFSIEQMGIWNIDKYINNQQFVKIKAGFDFTAQINPYINKIKVHVINHTDNTTQDYMAKDWDKIYLRSGTETSIMAVLPDNKIAVFDKDQFGKVDFNKVYSGTREYRFDTKIYSAGVGDIGKLKEML